VYERALRDLLGTDVAGLTALRDGLAHTSKTAVGCAGSFPTASLRRDGFRSAEDRRVEVFFFAPGQEPRLDCHPRADICVKSKCDLHNPRAYVVKHLPVVPKRLDATTLRLAITDVAGLYRPGHDDRDPDRAHNDPEIERRSGYQPGYRSQDDLGRIFVNSVPRVQTSTSWQSVRTRDTQYIELTVRVSATQGRVPGGLRVDWSWVDPDDLSDEPMNTDAAQLIDPNDGLGPLGDDNVGVRDWPTKDAGAGAAFEEMPGFGLIAGADMASCHTAIVDGVTKVRLHCTNVAGDNFRVSAFLRDAPQASAAMGASTGTMTVWKRIDLEYREMAGAVHLPVEQAAAAFEQAFVQLDVHWLSDAPTKAHMSKKAAHTHRDVRAYLRKSTVFENHQRPGWFVLISALLPAEDIKEDRVIQPLHEGEGRFVDDDWGAAVVVDYAVPCGTGVAGVKLFEGKENVSVFSAPELRRDTPRKGQTTIVLYGNDRQPELQPQVGSETGSSALAYAKRRFSFPRHSHHFPGGRVEDGGLGFPETTKLSVWPTSAGGAMGMSPYRHHAGKAYFAGQTVVFSRHRGLRKKGKLLYTVMHELGHAFGYAHKCGHYTADESTRSSCAMNYGSTWLYEPGGFRTYRFNTGTQSYDRFCARHLAGIRQVHLEDNPALWKKW